ncbi:DUF2993 domain-containing protein [Naumannella sp. ID2617S]|uniref:DUF2993 domain-containing protein n=1 Tax=Enemella dayhoffiae TaxID=2016507 RepID=A0A255GN91_9ACTN|nr:DUF2993 domain-containing protein [Enemella dayhoffiae]NNG19583.1 DUF2993 domain-containing protein [Naumannella sp. ID2617S]OYO17298.1 hypothetical protein CGZ93_17210 [Enemella dayhoffiae]
MSRRRQRGPVILLVVVVLLVAGVIVADRVARTKTNEQVAAQLQTQLGLAERPTVDIIGFPFLTQVAANRFNRVNVEAAGVRTGGDRPLTVRALHLQLGEVTTADNYRRITAGSLQGSAEVGWASVQEAAGVPVTPLPDGRVELTVSLSVLGQRAPVTLRGRPVLDVNEQSLRVREVQAELAGYQLPAAVVQRMVDQAVPSVPLNLPMGIRAESLQLTGEGPMLGLAGRNVVLTGG